MIFLFSPLKLPNKGMEGIFQNNPFHSIPFSPPKWSVRALGF